MSDPPEDHLTTIVGKDKKELILEYHPNTIKHLGISLYSTLPPVIANDCQ